MWHCRQSRLTLLTFSMCGLAPPWVIWQDEQPSIFTGACSKTNGPCLSAWHLKQTASCVAEVRTCLGPRFRAGLWQSLHWIRPSFTR